MRCSEKPKSRRRDDQTLTRRRPRIGWPRARPRALAVNPWTVGYLAADDGSIGRHAEILRHRCSSASPACSAGLQLLWRWVEPLSWGRPVGADARCRGGRARGVRRRRNALAHRLLHQRATRTRCTSCRPGSEQATPGAAAVGRGFLSALAGGGAEARLVRLRQGAWRRGSSPTASTRTHYPEPRVHVRRRDPGPRAAGVARLRRVATREGADGADVLHAATSKRSGRRRAGRSRSGTITPTTGPAARSRVSGRLAGPTRTACAPKACR